MECTICGNTPMRVQFDGQPLCIDYYNAAMAEEFGVDLPKSAVFCRHLIIVKHDRNKTITKGKRISFNVGFTSDITYGQRENNANQIRPAIIKADLKEFTLLIHNKSGFIEYNRTSKTSNRPPHTKPSPTPSQSPARHQYRERQFRIAHYVLAFLVLGSK